MNAKLRWAIALGLLALLVTFTISGCASSLVSRLYKDQAVLRERLRGLGWLAPVALILVQALQVIISPIPGEATGFLGGYLFGFVPGFILAFVIYLIPGFPKDVVSYLFGITPMRASVFALVSTVGRMPGTWVLSAQGASTASGQYVELALVTALTAAVAIPLYYYRERILNHLRRSTGGQKQQGARNGNLEGPGCHAVTRVEVYGKRDCSLCEAVKASLLKVQREIPFDLREIDIGSTPELYQAYKERIPLVVINGRLAFKFRVDEEALRRRLAREGRAEA